MFILLKIFYLSMDIDKKSGSLFNSSYHYVMKTISDPRNQTKSGVANLIKAKEPFDFHKHEKSFISKEDQNADPTSHSIEFLEEGVDKEDTDDSDFDEEMKFASDQLDNDSASEFEELSETSIELK